ncbi:MAG TPA: glycoside hydrolase family 15 protein [Actinocrinis sp.]|uniref:glycoside hydrolase family 15 protein n=1 Tax=Actinocrinis sp. TaxID=1920516 RepID=UPI002DDD8F27|nr:glycoside hydrolase family 15 protein [Actinocrinis sp.]HEV2345991.1 glycoside hydrolase family 15 protein [Actinocrinis sp.]
MTAGVVVVAGSVSAVVFTAGPAGATGPTQPSAETARSLYMNNWTDTTGIWMAPQLAQTDTNTQYGPRLAELHYSPNAVASAASAVNQIVDYTGFFRDETHGVKYDQVHNFGSATGYLDSGGILRSDYGPYSGTAMPVSIGRDYAMVPNQHFMVVTYRLTNTTASAVTMNVLDSVHLNNTSTTGATVHATYDSTRDADIADMSASGQYQIVLGSFGASSGHQVGDDTVSNTSSPTVAPWYTFDASGTLPGNASVTAGNVDIALSKLVSVPANSTATTSFYLAIAATSANALAAADTARGSSDSSWASTTMTAYSNWLAAGKQTTSTFTDTGLSTAYDRSLVVMKQTQNPVLGTWPAATNPIAYGYKTWIRDSAVTALAMDTAGHHAEAAKYYNWLITEQNSDGSFGTTYNEWTGAFVSFVQPEDDSIGIFLMGVLRHYQQTGDTTFRDAMWPAVQKAAGFISGGIQSNGFGPSDFSIWEETQEYNAFTQATYEAGLWAAEQYAQAEGNNSLADSWSSAAGSIGTALQRSSLASPAGMWNAPSNYYDRAVNTDNTARVSPVDSSSDMLLVLGVIDAASSRAVSHVSTITADLTHDTFGVARYQGDVFYYTSPFSPAGNEAGAAEPSWPQMSMYLAIQEIFTGDTTTALNRLTWYVTRTATGYMPPGEATSNVTQKPIGSTMVEPVTGAWYVLAALAYGGQTDTRVYPTVVRAGMRDTLTVSAGTTGDWPQWNSVPYFTDQVGDAVNGDPDTDIRDVAAANDDSNIYVRVDNADGHLPAYQTATEFGVDVYSADFSGAASATTTVGIDGSTLPRPVSYLVARRSGDNRYLHYHVANGAWVQDADITSVIAPQWDPATGRIELVIPRSALASSSTANGTVEPLTIELEHQNPTTLAWTEDDTSTLLYRLTDTTGAALYGNVR